MAYTVIQKTDFRQRKVGANAVILKKNFFKAFLKLFYRPTDDLSYISLFCVISKLFIKRQYIHVRMNLFFKAPCYFSTQQQSALLAHPYIPLPE